MSSSRSSRSCKEENRALRQRQDSMMTERATPPAEERAGARAGRSDDRPPEGDGAQRMTRSHDASQRPDPRKGISGRLPARRTLRAARLGRISQRQDARDPRRGQHRRPGPHRGHGGAEPGSRAAQGAQPRRSGGYRRLARRSVSCASVSRPRSPEDSSSSCDRSELFFAAVRCRNDGLGTPEVASQRGAPRQIAYGAACGVRHVSGYLSTLM